MDQLHTIAEAPTPQAVRQHWDPAFSISSLWEHPRPRSTDYPPGSALPLPRKSGSDRATREIQTPQARPPAHHRPANWQRCPRLPQPVLVILISLLDQRQGRHLLGPEEIPGLELNGFGLAPCRKDHRFVLEHLLIDVERRAQQRAKRRQGAQLEAWKVLQQLLFGGKPHMM